MDSLIETFHIDWKLILAQAVNFAIVFFVLYRYALKPLGTLMDERKNEIEKGLADAKENASLLTQTEQKYQEALAVARQEASAIIANAKKEATLQKEQILNETKVTSDAMLLANQKELLAEKNKMMQEAKKELASLVVRATEKVLEGTVHGPLAEQLVATSIDAVTKHD